MRTFHARAVAAQEIDDVRVLVLAENPDGSGLRVEIQTGPHDDQDVRLGMDTYCICTETGATHYGGVTSWNADQSQGCLEIVLDANASDRLGVDRGFKIMMSDHDLQLARAFLTRVL